MGRRIAQNPVEMVADVESFRDLGRMASGAGQEVFMYVWPVASGVAISEPVAYQAFMEGHSEGGEARNPGRLSTRFKSCVAAVRARIGAGSASPRPVAESRRRARGNPSGAAAKASEGFHGRPVEEVIEVTQPVHYHRDLADCGELISLLVVCSDGGLVRLSGFDGARLAFNEDRNQLFIRGGDQFVDVEQFGLQADAHELASLGHVKRIVYHTVKVHLGDEGGDADYVHDFGEETLKERGVKRPGPDDFRQVCPELLYRFRNPSLEFAGGLYTVEDEGIRN